MEPWERALLALKRQEPDEVPVVLLVYGMVLKRFGNVMEKEYYMNVKLQLEAKVAFQRRFPEVVNMLMGTFPEYGEFVGPIPTAFGGKLGWLEDAPPYVAEYPIKTPEDVDKIAESGIPDPRETGISAEFLKKLEYFYEWFPKDLREKYGYIDGNVYPGLCVEGAALAMGYDRFLIWMRDYPDALHKWLRIATDWYIKYCEAIEEIVGKCKILWVPDHTASMVGKAQFREFVLPYLNKVFNRYKGALRIWHNEGRVGHMPEEVDKIDAEVWQFGAFDDPVLCKQKTHFCLQGNIHPPWFAKYSTEQVQGACKALIEKVAEGGGFWLSTGGGAAPGTPLRNIEAMVNAVKKFGKYPISRR